MGPAPWAPRGARCTISRTLYSLPLKIIPTKFGVNPLMCFKKNVKYSHKGPTPNLSPPQGPNGTTLGLVMNNYNLPHIEVSTHKVT